MDRRNITSVILCTTTMVHSLLIVAVQQHRYITYIYLVWFRQEVGGGLVFPQFQSK